MKKRDHELEREERRDILEGLEGRKGRGNDIIIS